MVRQWGALELLAGPPTLPLHPASKAYVDAAASTAGANWLNVKALGATGNGTTDDSAAIQAVLTTAATSGTGNVVYFPAGMYRIGTRLTVPSGVVLRGVSSGTYPGNAAIAESSILARTASMNDHVLYWAAGTAYGHVIDLSIDGNKNNNTSGSGIYLQDAAASEEAQVIVERCYIHDNPDANIYLGHNRRANKILNSVCNYSANSDGILIAGSDNTVSGCIVGSNGRSGIGVGSHNTQNYSGSGFGATVTHVDRCDTYGNTMAGIAVSAFSTLTMITNCGIDRNNRQGVTIYDGSSCSIYGNALHSNGVGTNNTYGHIDLATGVVSCSLIGNQFGPLDGGVSNVASYGVTVVNTATVVMGMGNTLDSTATVGGLTNATTPWQLSLTSISAPAISALGLTGATAASRHVGGTVAGAPTTGTFLVGDWVTDQTGRHWTCVTAGSPGTWVGSIVTDNTTVPLLPSSVAAAGGSLLAAPANHLHPRYDWAPPDHGLLAWTEEIGAVANNSLVPTAGTLYLVRLHVPLACSVTNLLMYCTTGGTTMTSGQNFAALFNPSPMTRVGATADQSATWNSSGLKTMALVSGPFNLAAGDFYAGFYTNAATLPSFARGSNIASAFPNIGLSAANSRAATSSTGLTTAMPTTAATLAASAFIWWIGLN